MPTLFNYNNFRNKDIEEYHGENILVAPGKLNLRSLQISNYSSTRTAEDTIIQHTHNISTVKQYRTHSSSSPDLLFRTIPL